MRKIYYIVTSILAVLATILFVALTLSPSPEDDGSMFITTLLLIAMAAGCLFLSVIGLKNNSPIRPVISEKAGILITGFGAIVFVVGLYSDGLMLQALPIAIPALALGILCFTKGRNKLKAAQAAEKWNAYKEALFAKMPSLKDTLREGASAADIRKAEAELGLRFPEPLKGLYLTNDGDNGKAVCGAILGLHFLSLKEMCMEWRSMKELLESKDINKNSNSTSSPEGCIKRCYGNNKWLPLASDASGNFIGIDLDPDIHGTAGQIINWGRDEENKMVFAENADAFWERLTGIVNSRDFFIGDYDGEDVILLGTDDIEEGTHLTDYLKHTGSPETAAYYEIAGLLGLSAAHRGMIDSPARYYADHKANFEERSVGADETNAIRWLGIIDEMIGQNKICEFDFKEEKADFLAGLQRILPEALTIDASRLDEDADISAWAEQINASWQDTGYVLIGFDIDSDSYVTYVCTKEVFSKLSKAAKMVWHRVALLQDL